jgi:hypothetical protein
VRAGTRETFEAFQYARKNRGAKRDTMFARLPDDTYMDESVQRHWWTWQCALAEAQAALEAVTAENAQLRERVEFLRAMAQDAQQLATTYGEQLVAATAERDLLREMVVGFVDTLLTADLPASERLVKAMTNYQFDLAATPTKAPT